MTMRWLLAAILLAAAPAAAQDAPRLTARPDLGMNLPPGFDGTVFHKMDGIPRVLAVSDDGVVYTIRFETSVADGRGGWFDFFAPKFGLFALKDDDGDGLADRREAFGGFAGSGLAVRRDGDGQEWIYASSETEIWRWRRAPGELAPSAKPQRVAKGFPRQAEHPYKPIAFDDAGGMYVMVGAPSNVCNKNRRQKDSPSLDPCPQLDEHAGVWKFDADALEQDFADSERWASGLRNMVAFAWSRSQNGLYGLQHGRDVLARLFPQFYSDADSAELPAEEFHRIERGDDLGWPYSYFDHRAGVRMVNPEYGGDGGTAAESGKKPLIGFPGHWAPMALAFYERGNAVPDAFPDAYAGGVFAVFKGGWNRAPLPQQGFRVVYIPMADGVPSGPWSTFADGFKGKPDVAAQGGAAHLPTSAAVGPEGALYLGDQKTGTIWRVAWVGTAATNGYEDLPLVGARAAATAAAALPAMRGVSPSDMARGRDLYDSHCQACHQADGSGMAQFQPPLINSKIVRGAPKDLAAFVLRGSDPIADSEWSGVMPAFATEDLSDEDMALLLNYIRAAFTKAGKPVTENDVAAARAGTP